MSSTHAIAALWSSDERPPVAAADAFAADWSEHEKLGHAKPLNLRMPRERDDVPELVLSTARWGGQGDLKNRFPCGSEFAAPDAAATRCITNDAELEGGSHSSGDDDHR